MKKNPNQSEKTRLYQGIMKIDEYRRFIEWLAMPSFEKDPRTQTEFAERFGVSQDTLTDWKAREELWEAVDKLRKMKYRGLTNDVIESLYMRSMSKKGSANDTRLWFEYVDNWNPKIQIETKNISVVQLLVRKFDLGDMKGDI